MSLITPDSGLIVWMTLIFAIVFFLLAKFGFPVISKTVKDRSTKIEESLRKADEAEKRLSELAQEQQEMIEKARLEQSQILKEATQARDTIIEQAKTQARAEADKLIVQARERISSEREAAILEIRQEVARLSVGVAEKIVRRDLDNTEAQKQLLDRFFEEVCEADVDVSK